MEHLLQLSWWFSFFPASWHWWFFCFVASMAAFPLVLRVFRGMADRGAGLSTGVGLIVVNFLAWILSLETFGGDHRAVFVRVLCIAAAFGLFGLGALFTARGYVAGTARRTIYFPGVLLLLLGILPLSHGGFSIWLSVMLLATVSVACWLHDIPGFVRSVKVVAVPFVAAQIIFFTAFLFFVNVRSYIPFATYELSLYEAEKWGNFTHLQSVMTTAHMPPRDLWFHGEPTNYYYAGHLMVATIAKATGTTSRIAFNLGLATIFALTMSMGFSFVLSLAHLTTRKLRLFGNFIWHHGMLWGMLGALAIGMFGNLDSWRQVLSREMDYGVQIRWQRRVREVQELWKEKSGISAVALVNIANAATTGEYYERPAATLRELERAEIEASGNAARLKELAKSVADAVAGQGVNKEDEVNTLIFSPAGEALLRSQNAKSSEIVKEEIFLLLAGKKYEQIENRLKNLADGQRDVSEKYKSVSTQLDAAMQKAVEHSSLSNILKTLQNEESGDQSQRLLGIPRTDAEWKMQSALKNKSLGELGAVLTEFQKAIEASQSAVKPKDQEFLSNVATGLKVVSIEPMTIIQAQWGNLPPLEKSAPTIADLRFTWDNFSYIDFWQPSRAIKSSPPGVTEPGTITEFPYFSAILGDLHPHHMAIPFTLAALCACLSLLRKNSRLRTSEKAFWLRSWQELAAMSFFIGAVFPVNIWDAVVLAPLYAVVIAMARRKVVASACWRWVGLAGFIVLLTVLVALPLNSIPGVTPLFQNFKGFALALLIVVPGIPLLLAFFPDKSRAWMTAGAVCAALLIVALTGLNAAGAGGPLAHRSMATAMRDLLLFGAIAGLAAWWSIRRARGASYWWYSAGAIYAVVGGAALFLILPFKLWFQSPLTPENKILYTATPPFLSYDLTGTKGDFWGAFWDASPINPFPQELRTEMRDYFEHWGIFLIPIIAFAIARFLRAAKNQPPGFTFMMSMIVLAVVGFTRNYLGFWVGPLSLGMVVLSIYFAVRFRQKAESPAWVFLAVAFFWTWFVEALHFNDDYSGAYERYNTPFKIYYPIWAMFAGGMVVAVKEGLARFRFKDRSPSEILFSSEIYIFAGLLGVGATLLFQKIFPRAVALGWFYAIWIPCIGVLLVCILSYTKRTPDRLSNAVASEAARAIAGWPALVAAVVILILGMHYPVSATATRTREFFTWPLAGMSEARQPQRDLYMNCTLDALEHLSHFPEDKDDYEAMTFLAQQKVEKKIPTETVVLERAGEDAYSAVGRISTGSGLRSVVGWGHHEHQWRGRAAPAPEAMKLSYRKEVRDMRDLGVLFNDVIPNADKALKPEDQDALRLAGNNTRITILRTLFPMATLMDLYRMRRIVEKNDINMQVVMDAMLRHVEEMYTSADLARVKELFARYKVGYVVVGDLERKKYGADTDKRFVDWGFTSVFESTKSDDPDSTSTATILYTPPPDFAMKEKVGQ